jgi:dTDP-4-amino-4,6-dideoxygalactose transaminase
MASAPTSIPPNKETAVPALLPFTRPHISEDDIAAVVEVLRSGWITTGPKAAAFEKALSEYFGGRPVRCFNSGTATLEVALRVAGIGEGDEVITTPLSWVATGNVILTVGARPVFIDVDPDTRNMNIGLIEAAITPKTKAIIPVHLAGLPLNMPAILSIAKRHGLRVIEDAAQAIGSNIEGQRIGSFGDLASFSFHANKNLTTSEGGCLVFNSEQEAQLATKYRLQGLTRFGTDGMDVDVLGGKFNMTDIAAALGLSQLKQIEQFTEQRKVLAKHYFKRFSEPWFKASGIELPIADFDNSNWHMFQLVLPAIFERSKFIEAMKENAIVIGVHYPAMHLFSLYRELGFELGQFPIAERIGAKIITLPLFPDMHTDDVDRVADTMKAIVQ